MNVLKTMAAARTNVSMNSDVTGVNATCMVMYSTLSMDARALVKYSFDLLLMVKF